MINNGTDIGIGIRRRITVIGAGPAGLALAAEIESHGFTVLIYAHPSHARHATKIAEKGHMEISGVVRGSVSPRFTFDMQDAVNFSHILILTVPSTGQDTVLVELKHFSLLRHAVIAIPGNMFSLVAEAAGVHFGCVMETNLSPYSCRLTEQEDLLVWGKKSLFHIAAFQNDLSAEYKEEIASILPTVKFKWCHSIAEVNLNNVNGIFHPLMMLMNVGRIESTTDSFLLYRDGLTPSVAAAMSALDQVRINIGTALGLELLSTLQTSNECYGHDFTDLVELAQNSKPHNRLEAPSSIDHRNIVEDVPDVLVFWHDLAIALGIDAAPITAVIVLARMATGVDFMKQGRGLEKLKLADCTRKELVMRLGNPNC